MSVHWIAAAARELGFDLVGMVPASPLQTAGYFSAWVEAGYHGLMAYLGRPDSVARRADLDSVLRGVRTVLTVAVNYHTLPLPPQCRDDPSRGVVASYAWGDDYHNVLMPRLRQLASRIEDELGTSVAHRAYVDTGPILERELAARAGLGFVGKNTNLIHPRFGSWLFLGELLLTFELPANSSGQDTAWSWGESGTASGTCGRCTRCMEACPTGALLEPYQLDARRCISYLTIELKGPVPHDLRPLLANRVFGCDICQEVCPWNQRFAQPSEEPSFQPRLDGLAPALLDLIALDDDGFRQRFHGSPVKRAKRRGLLRNVAVALGNWRDPVAVPALGRALDDSEPLVRGHAAWALGQIATRESRGLLEWKLRTETDPWVRAEFADALLGMIPQG